MHQAMNVQRPVPSVTLKIIKNRINLKSKITCVFHRSTVDTYYYHYHGNAMVRPVSATNLTNNFACRQHARYSSSIYQYSELSRLTNKGKNLGKRHNVLAEVTRNREKREEKEARMEKGSDGGRLTWVRHTNL